jgi:hypothetical protein
MPEELPEVHEDRFSAPVFGGVVEQGTNGLVLGGAKGQCQGAHGHGMGDVGNRSSLADLFVVGPE